MWRNVASNGIMLIIALMLGAAVLVTWAKGRYEAAGPLTEAICLTVDRGGSMAKVSEDLAAKGAITEALIFRQGAKFEKKDAQLKAGSFLITEGASMRDIVERITGSGVSSCGTEILYRLRIAGPSVQVRDFDPETGGFKTVAEFDPREVGTDLPAEYKEVKAEPGTRIRVQVVDGVTSWQVVEGLKAAEFLTGTIAEVPGEGRIAPESYEVQDGADRAQLLARMVELQDRRLAEAWANRSEGVLVSTPEQALILASLIEKETGVAAERPVVSSVLANRIRSNMRLQIDSSVEYGVSKGQGPLGRGLRRSELDRDTPYNLYTRNGLPPGPIANPGLASIQAAVNPASTDFLYFVADGTGGHIFAATLAEHNANVAKWRQIEAERARGTAQGN